MVSVLSRLMPADRSSQRDDVTDRLRTLGRLVSRLDGRLDDDRLGPARALLDRAGVRLKLSAEHTVVALVGATGSGKSSLFNALAGLPLSRVGVRRPTTGQVHACVWGFDGAAGLLDWLGVPQRHQVERESELDADEQADLRGLILLDLPDFDSTEPDHRLAAERLVSMVDLLVWVVDPQKYADRVLHERYLRPLAGHSGVTVVVLNQADLLGAAEVSAVRQDLQRLLTADGLTGVPVVPTSARTGAGLPELREQLVRAVTTRQTAAARVAADLRGVVAGLVSAGGPPAVEEVPRPVIRRFTVALARAAGVPPAAAAVEQAYRYRAARHVGWPIARWLRLLRPDPVRRLRLNRPLPPEGSGEPDESLTGDTSASLDLVSRTVPDRTNLPVPTPVQLAQVDVALRDLCQSAASGLPEPWPRVVATAGRSRAGSLPDALDGAISAVDLRADRRPLWWRGVGLAQGALAVGALIGAGWLLLLFLLDVLRLAPLDVPTLGVLPVPTLLLFGGLLLGALLATCSAAVARWAARLRRRHAERSLNEAVATVVRAEVLAPIRAELRAYAEARDALAALAASEAVDGPTT